MPEGPSIVIAREKLKSFKGKKILAASGNAKFDKDFLTGQKVIAILSWGKHLILQLKKESLRIHFLMFGTYSINEVLRPVTSLRLKLSFAEGDIYFYTCSVKLLDGQPNEIYDWEGDVMNDRWNPAKARKKLKTMPRVMVCDALLDQNIFAGVGNIIKNEVLYRIFLHPETRLGNIPPRKLTELIREARKYSFDFLKWKKAFVLKKHWLAHTKKTCHRCQLPIIKKYCGKTNRRTFFCKNCQVKYTAPATRG